MTGLNELTTLAYVKADIAKDKAVSAVKSFGSDERGVEGFVVALILIGIAALLATVFQSQITELLKDVMDKVREQLGIS